MPSWWRKSSSKEGKKKKDKENFIGALLHRKSKIPFEDEGCITSGETQCQNSEIASEKGSLSQTESRLTSPSKEVSHSLSFAERRHAQSLPVPGGNSPSIGRITSEISISRPAPEYSGRSVLILPLPKPDCILSRSTGADVDGDLATASFSSGCSTNSVDHIDSIRVNSQGNGYEVEKTVTNSLLSNVQKDQSPIITQKVSTETLKLAKPLFGNQHPFSSSKKESTKKVPSKLQIPPNGAFGIRSAPDSSLSSPCRSPIRGVSPEQITSSAFWPVKPYPDVSFLGYGHCSSPVSGHNSGHDPIGGEMSGKPLWKQSKSSNECSPMPSPKMTSPGPSSRIQSGSVTPEHPRAGGGAAQESPTNWPDDGKQKSHRLPLPPITIFNSSPYSPSNSPAGISSLVLRSPGRADHPTSPGSRWKKGKLIGRGTFGQVYVGFNSESGEMCAMKEVTLFSDDAKSRESAKQLIQEISLLSRLQHQNIVQYYGSETVDDKLYIYLEYVSGGSIHKLLQEYGQFGEMAIRSFTQQILAGLSYLHSMNTVHRDIKGANILVDPNRHVKLADFGMAKHITGHSCPLSFKGSPYWMAPEVIKNSSGCNLAVDIWSLGCTVLEMATGKPPWSQYEGVAAMFKIGNSKELPVIPDHLSDECKDFVKQCLQRNPLHRPTAAKLLEHPFLKNAALLEKPTLGSEPTNGVNNGMGSMGLRHARPLSSRFMEGLAIRHHRGPKAHPATSDAHVPKYISCPVSPIGSPLLCSRSPRHINVRMYPSPISSPRTTGSSTPLNGANGAIPFHHYHQHDGFGNMLRSQNVLYANSYAHYDPKFDVFSEAQPDSHVYEQLMVSENDILEKLLRRPSNRDLQELYDGQVLLSDPVLPRPPRDDQVKSKNPTTRPPFLW